MSKKISLSKFDPSENDKVLLDTNILIKLFYPIQYDNKIEQYEKLYEKLKKSKSKLILTSTQISEFINRCIRLQFAIYKECDQKKDIDFKRDYRGTTEYNDNMDAILEIIESDIFSSFVFINDGFDKIEKEKLLIHDFSYDFNDALLVEIAKSNEAILVTNDVDFAYYNVDLTIVTSNTALLRYR